MGSVPGMCECLLLLVCFFSLLLLLLHSILKLNLLRKSQGNRTSLGEKSFASFALSPPGWGVVLHGRAGVCGLACPGWVSVCWVRTHPLAVHILGGHTKADLEVCNPEGPLKHCRHRSSVYSMSSKHVLCHPLTWPQGYFPRLLTNF